MSETPGNLAAALDEIRANHEAANVFGANSGDPVPRLLAVVDEVLELPAKWEAASEPGFSALEEDRAWVRQACAADLREAISRRLLGKEGGDER